MLRGLECAASWISREAAAGGQLKRGSRREERRRRDPLLGFHGRSGMGGQIQWAESEGVIQRATCG